MKKKCSLQTSSTSSGPPNKPKLVAGVTIGSSAFSFLRGQLKWFVEHNWDVVLVSSPDRKARAAAEREGVPLVGIPMDRGISPIRDMVSLIRWVKYLARERPGALSVGTPKASFLGILAAYIVGVPRRLYIVRGLRLEGAKKPLSYILWLMEWVTMLLATDVFYVSKSLASECKRRKLYFPAKSWLIGEGSSNGVDAIGIQEVVEKVDRDNFRSEIGFSSQDFVVGFVGRINTDKGVNMILQALEDPKLAANIRVLMLGDIEDDSLAEKIRSFDDRIVNVGWKDDAWSYFPAMDVLCLPTRREGFPNVVLEAGAAGIPTLTTEVTGAIDSVIPGQTGALVKFGDVTEIVDALNTFASNPAAAKEMGQAARERVLADFNPESIWNGLNEILTGQDCPRFAKRCLKESRM
ncbi:glycosyltransferase, group 1 family protein [Corynebacterium efficiens YS-314]|nr:glycosyltransferase, group 1 family protein [Corynebacterium efficiens YS-314]